MGSRYVSNELAGTRQAAARQHQTAALRQAEADAAEAAGDEAERTRPAREATDAVALARALDQQAAQMEVSDDARAQFLAHTAMARVKAERAEAMLAEHHAVRTMPQDRLRVRRGAPLRELRRKERPRAGR
jgi:hypothetical protein